MGKEGGQWEALTYGTVGKGKAGPKPIHRVHIYPYQQRNYGRAKLSYSLILAARSLLSSIFVAKSMQMYVSISILFFISLELMESTPCPNLCYFYVRTLNYI